MNNLHRELAPISAAAWQEIDDEARRTFTERIAGRRVVDVPDPAGLEYSAAGTGHIRPVEAPVAGVSAQQRVVLPTVELRVPFFVDRSAVDDVDRGALDSDWQPVKDAATLIATAEDHAIFHGSQAAGIEGIAPASSNAAVALPAKVEDFPAAVAQGMNSLRLAGVEGDYFLVLNDDLYTEVAETTDHGYPIRDHISRILGDGKIIWAPGVEDALLVTDRGGDFTLQLGQDLSIGYLSHDAERIQLYLQESFTFLVHTSEASVVLKR